MAEPGQWPGPQWITVSSTPSKIGWSRLILGISMRPICWAGTLACTSPPRFTLWALAGRAVGTGAAGGAVVVVGVVGGAGVADRSAAPESAPRPRPAKARPAPVPRLRGPT